MARRELFLRDRRGDQRGRDRHWCGHRKLGRGHKRRRQQSRRGVGGRNDAGAVIRMRVVVMMRTGVGNDVAMNNLLIVSRVHML